MCMRTYRGVVIMFTHTRSFQIILASLLTLFTIQAHALSAFTKALLRAHVAGTYVTPTDEVSLGGENVVVLVNRDKTANLQFMSINFDPVKPDFSLGINTVPAEWDVVGIDGNQIELELFFTEVIRDPNGVFIPKVEGPGGELIDQCNPGCYLFGVIAATYENGSFVGNEVFAAMDLNLQPVDMVFGPTLAIEGLTFQSFPGSEIKQRIINAGGDLPVAP